MQHPDEGTIHAWLDGQLPATEAAAIDAHVAECRSCADAVAEARGLIAASSRILTTLDGVPRDVAPKQPAPNAVVDLPARSAPVVRRAPRRWLSGPSLAAAAVVMVAVGTFTVSRRSGDRNAIGVEQEAADASGPLARDSIAYPVPSAVVAPASPPPAAVGAPNVVARSPESRSVAADQAFGDRAVRANEPAKATVQGALGAAASAREETKQELDQTRRVKELASSADTMRRQFAQVEATVDRALAKKADTTTVTITRGSTVSAQRAAPSAGAAAPTAPPAPASPTRDGRADAAATVATSATTGFVRGRVTDGNGTGISGAQVLVVGTTTSVTTSAAGEFSLGGVPQGQAQLVVRRIGYQSAQSGVTVVAGQSAQTEVVLTPVATSLSEVVVTGTATEQRRQALGSSIARSRAASDSAPGAAVTATQSRAIGCYEMGITPSTASRVSLRQVPRRVALDGEIVPANADGIWYRARDLTPGAKSDGLWRPVGTNGVEIEWLYGSKVARLRLTGAPQAMMRGELEEMDRSGGANESGSVVSSRRACP
jgi:anti-sigma factor RsiW